jgi:hypothetical protein
VLTLFLFVFFASVVCWAFWANFNELTTVAFLEWLIVSYVGRVKHWSKRPFVTVLLCQFSFRFFVVSNHIVLSELFWCCQYMKKFRITERVNEKIGLAIPIYWLELYTWYFGQAVWYQSRSTFTITKCVNLILSLIYCNHIFLWQSSIKYFSRIWEISHRTFVAMCFSR